MLPLSVFAAYENTYINTGNSLEDMISTLREPAEEKEMRFRILSDDFRPEGEKIISLFENAVKLNENWSAANDNHEGIRINADENHGNGWFLIRLSVHDPIIVLNAESDEIGGIMKMAKDIHGIISTAENIDLLDISALNNYIK